MVKNLLGDLIDYEAAWELQKQVHEAVVSGESPGTLLLVEHPPVFTAGKRTRESDRPKDGSPVYDVDRGGRITWHGPGQLVGYPIVRLPEPFDVVAFVRRLEVALMGVCTDLGLETIQVPDRTGVWVPATGTQAERKVAAIGCRVARGVTMHGFSLNCDNDLSWYERIVPCGIEDAGVTTLTRELGRPVTIGEVAPAVESAILEQLGEWAS